MYLPLNAPGGNGAQVIAAFIEAVTPFTIMEGKNNQEGLGLEWLAKKLWVNASYLSRLFSQEAGQPLTNYINYYPIEQAKKLIATTNLRLYDIAERTGFSSSIVFSTVFKKMTGETPTDYRSKTV